jgi:hypothetical protein
MKWILLSIVVTATALSDLLQSHEMKRAGEQSVGAGPGAVAADDRQAPLSDPLDRLPGDFVLRVHGAGAACALAHTSRSGCPRRGP